LRHTLTGLRGRIFDLLTASDCYLCACPSGGGALCGACAATLPRHAAPCCPCCALPTPGGEWCGACLGAPPAFAATRPAFDYVFPVDVLVQAFKYRHRLMLADFFAAALASLPVADIDLIVPMPLHPRRLAERGFNQAVEMARPLARALGIALEADSVVRVRDTPAQASLDHDARLINMRGAFACRRRFDGLRVMVVDDVMTTGASLDALARCLKASGAARVDNLVVARTVLGRSR
jgi:ComF family protein